MALALQLLLLVLLLIINFQLESVERRLKNRIRKLEETLADQNKLPSDPETRVFMD